MAANIGLTKDQARRIGRACKSAEATNFTGTSAAKAVPQPVTRIKAIISTNATAAGLCKHAWTAARFNVSTRAYETISGGSTGTTTDNYAIVTATPLAKVPNGVPVTLTREQGSDGKPFWAIEVPTLGYAVAESGGSAFPPSYSYKLYWGATYNSAWKIADGVSASGPARALGAYASAGGGVVTWHYSDTGTPVIDNVIEHVSLQGCGS